MHFIYLVRRGRKYHTDQSHRILLTRYFFTSGRGRHFDLSPLAVQRVATRLDRCVCRVCCVYVAHVTTGYSCTPPVYGCSFIAPIICSISFDHDEHIWYSLIHFYARFIFVRFLPATAGHWMQRHKQQLKIFNSSTKLLSASWCYADKA